MTKQDLFTFVQQNGKIKEPISYDLPWTVIIPEDAEENDTPSN